jgi:3,4-dihydroxy 2-butanone 4-phosphate synthase
MSPGPTRPIEARSVEVRSVTEAPLVARPETAPALARAAHALASGEPILVYDAPDREGETDLIILSEHATPELIRLLRRDAGGLLCTAISAELRDRLGLPYADELLELGSRAYPILNGLRSHRLRYDRRSAFGISVNHVTNFTGVPDNDRATTVRAIGLLAREAGLLSDPALRTRFQDEFSSPGHIPLLYAAPRLLAERKGHTELAISLARMVGLSESVTVCEMLGDSGGPRSPDAAEEYATAHGWVFLEGRSIVDAWRPWSA